LSLMLFGLLPKVVEPEPLRTGPSVGDPSNKHVSRRSPARRKTGLIRDHDGL
jgi:hypothetical protein